MRNTALVIIGILFVGIFSDASAHSLSEVCGQISAFHKYPLKGVEVIEKKSKSNTKTDKEGKYCIPVNENDKLTIMI